MDSEFGLSIETVFDNKENKNIEISLSTNIADKININGKKLEFDEEVENTAEELNSLKLTTENISKHNQNIDQNDEKDIIIKTYKNTFKEIEQRVDYIGKILELWKLSHEKNENIKKSIPKIELFCQFCKIIGHSEFSCRQKKIFNKQNLKPVATRHDNDPRYPPSKTVYIPRLSYRQQRIMLYRNGGFKDKFLYKNKNKLKTIIENENNEIREDKNKEEIETSQVFSELFSTQEN